MGLFIKKKAIAKLVYSVRMKQVTTSMRQDVTINVTTSGTKFVLN